MKESLVTADMHVRYLGRPRGRRGRWPAPRSCKVGSQLIVVECKVLGGTRDDGDDHVIATADFSMMIVPLRRPMDGGATGAPGDPEL